MPEGKSSITTPVSFRLPNDVVSTLQRRIEGRRSRFDSIGLYLQEHIIWEVRRSHMKGKGIDRLPPAD
ncbi:hypothetical protein LCGC14_1069220 [marine sediment metagenome]|uniref:Ribbon-helix-helix protein CopG domain-containing protein n=1 Tax=marine sediment metagenome TaxID=412755 RepID=A0A0F9MIQ7_9ZZZZ